MTASPNSSPSSQSLVRYVEDARALIAGNAVKLLRNGAEAFPAWLAAIDSATRRVSLEMYIFSDDGIGRRFAEALGRAAQRGVEVRLLYDFVGCRETPAAFFQRMRGFGVHVVGYHKYRFWRPRALVAHPAQPPQDPGLRRGPGLHGRDQHLERVGQSGRGGRRLARRRRRRRGAGGGADRGDVPADLEPARAQADAPRSRSPADSGGPAGSRWRWSPTASGATAS